MGLSLWNIFKVCCLCLPTLTRVKQIQSISSPILLTYLSCIYCLLATSSSGRFTGDEFGHDFKSETIPGQVRTGWLDDHGRACGIADANPNGRSVTCRAVPQGASHCLQYHYHFHWTVIWWSIIIRQEESKKAVHRQTNDNFQIILDDHGRRRKKKQKLDEFIRKDSWIQAHSYQKMDSFHSIGVLGQTEEKPSFINQSMHEE